MRIESNQNYEPDAVSPDRGEGLSRERPTTAEDLDRIKKFRKLMEGGEGDSESSGYEQTGVKSPHAKKELPSLSELFSSQHGHERDAQSEGEFNQANEYFTGREQEKPEENFNRGHGSHPDLLMTPQILGMDNAGAEVQNVAAVSSPDELLELAQNLTDRILVSKTDLAGDAAREVMISVNKEILPNTTISLSRDVNGMLFVSIVSSDPQSYKKLMDSQFMLENSLDQHERSAFRVEITYNGAGSEAYENGARSQAFESEPYSQRNV